MWNTNNCLSNYTRALQYNISKWSWSCMTKIHASTFELMQFISISAYFLERNAFSHAYMHVTHTFRYIDTPKNRINRNRCADFNAFNCLQIEYMCTALISWTFSCCFAFASLCFRFFVFVLVCFHFISAIVGFYYFISLPFRPMWILVFRSVSLHVMLLTTFDTYILSRFDTFECVCVFWYFM